jgi:capsular polysaccharide transport system permease protein
MSLTGPLDSDTPQLRRVGARRSLPTIRTIFALMVREMVTSYGRSPGGYLWAILEPAAGTALITAIFSLGFKSPPLGTHFGIFYASGLVPFFVYMDVVSKVGSSIQYSRSLLVYPAVTYVDAIIARFLINGMTQLMVAYIVLSFIIFALDAPVSIDVGSIALAFVMALALGLGVGTMNCFLFAMYPLWERIWAIVTRPLFFVSGVIFLHDNVPQPYRDWLTWNPLVHVVGESRSGFYARYDAAYVDVVYVFAFSGIALVIGLVFLFRYHRDILHN